MVQPVSITPLVETATAPKPGSREANSLPSPLELAVVIPTFNERENIAALISALEKALAGREWEAVFVDDHSPDGTAEYVRNLASTNRRIRVLERIGRHGLSSACIEGMLATPARYIAVMDADMQHDESILPKLLERIRLEHFDVVVASRNAPGGSMGEFSGRRARLSSFGARISRWVCRCDISDPMSGFFMVKRSFFESIAPRLTGTGFKLLVDLLASSPAPVRVGEVPSIFVYASGARASSISMSNWNTFIFWWTRRLEDSSPRDSLSSL
jgi:dolichol-phosphate mannosyltransferase